VAPLRVLPPLESGNQRVTSASFWAVSSTLVMSALRLVSQMVLSYLCLPEHFGAVMLMRTFLTLVEMLSDMGIRGSVLYHPQGENRRFLSTAFSVQILRGGGMWLLTCAIAWPVALVYHEPLFLWLLPLAGLESLNNGLLNVRVYVAERRLRQIVPTMLELLALAVSVVTSITWAWFRPGVWALASGPLIGGLVRAGVSHWIYRAEPTPLGWDRQHAREIFSFGRWVIGGTMVSFLAQQFHSLFLGRLVPIGVFGVYGVAWNFCAQATKPLTALANRVIIPHYAELNRLAALEQGGGSGDSRGVSDSLKRFLPACLLACLVSGLFAPALFGLFYKASFEPGGDMGCWLAVVVWFMVLQHVPRSVLLSQGASREVAGMALWNALVTVLGVVCGYWAGGRVRDGSLAITGAILGNALGNLAGCLVGWRSMKRRGLAVGRVMAGYSALFLALLASGTLGAHALARTGLLTQGLASLAITFLLALPLGAWVWRCVRPAARMRPAALES